MTKLLLRLLLISCMVLASLALVLNEVGEDFSDRFYHKFTYRANSMITGSSRALYALNPEMIDSFIHARPPFLNFAFTQRTSPFGELYYKAICGKVSEETADGIFVVEVTPLSVYSDDEYRSEEELILSKMVVYNMDPNYNYLFANSQRPFYQFFLHPESTNSVEHAHRSGWYAYDQLPDEATIRKQGEAQVKTLTNLFQRTQGLDYRYYWFNRTVEELVNHGQVILLRLPVAPEIRNMEQEYYPEFDSLMTAVAGRYKVHYLDMSRTSGWTYYDFQHMTAESANRFSLALGDTLRKSGLKPRG